MKTLMLTILMGAAAGALCWALAIVNLPRLLEAAVMFLTGAAMALVLAWRTLWSKP